MDQPPKVFITKFQPDWDFGPAADYGEVVFLTEHELKPEPTVGAHNDRLVDEMKRAMGDYVQGTDFIVMTAAAVNNVAVMMKLPVGPHNVLRWNNRKHRYELYKI